MPGKAISQFRKSNGMSQELLAEAARVSLRTIQRIESGVTEPRPHTLKAIADALQVSVTALEDHSKTNVESNSTLKLINLISLTVIVLPLLHILFMVQRLKRLDNSASVPAAKRIVSFQILWTIVTLASVICIPLLQHAITQSYVIGHFPPTIVIVYLSLLLANIAFIIHTARKLQSGNQDVLTFIPALF